MLENLSLIYPMFAMVLLTFAVLIALFRTRVKLVKKQQVKASYYKTYQGESEPVVSAKLSRHFSNIFETPTLFYIACLAALALGVQSALFVCLAWLYVLIRAIHAYIHIGANKLNKRILIYFMSWFVLLSMWVYLVASVSLV